MSEETTIEEITARMIVEDVEPLARKVTEISGKPYGIPNLSPDAELWAFSYEDTTIEPDKLRAAGMSEAEIGDHRFPLRPKLRNQAGMTYSDQQRYTDHMVERTMKAQEAGRVPKPPKHGPGSLSPMQQHQPTAAPALAQPQPMPMPPQAPVLPPQPMAQAPGVPDPMTGQMPVPIGVG